MGDCRVACRPNAPMCWYVLRELGGMARWPNKIASALISMMEGVQGAGDRQQRSASWPQSYELPSHCLNRFASSSASEAAVAPVVLSGALCDQPEGPIVSKEG